MLSAQRREWNSMDKEKLIELVNTSPELVDKHDREGWLNLFSSAAIVEDPVGAGMNRKGRDGLARFYDIFIAPNQIKFTVHQDIVIDNEMVREVSIHTTLANGAATEVHCYLIYRSVEEDGELKIESLRAHWDFGRSTITLLKGNGFKGIVASMAQFSTMIRVQGLKRVVEYLGAMYKGILKKGIKAVNAFAAAVNNADEAALVRLFDPSASIEFPAGKKISAGDFLKGTGNDLSLEVSGLRSCGWYTSCAFDARSGGANYHGVAFFQFNPKTKKIISTRFFWNEW
jgi:hypothetical protein